MKWTLLEYSLLLNSILLFCLLAPNIVYLIHKKHFKWKKDKTDYLQGAKDYCKSPLSIDDFIEINKK